jgi:methylmalonyl-CoA carboxyltransferase small subunit
VKLKILIDGTSYDVEVEEADQDGASEGSISAYEIQSCVLPGARLNTFSDFDEAKVCRSPLAGVVTSTQVVPGQHVKANELLLLLEAMKMEIKVLAPSEGTIKSIEATTGDAVRPNQILVSFE